MKVNKANLPKSSPSSSINIWGRFDSAESSSWMKGWVLSVKFMRSLLSRSSVGSSVEWIRDWIVCWTLLIAAESAALRVVAIKSMTFFGPMEDSESLLSSSDSRSRSGFLIYGIQKGRNQKKWHLFALYIDNTGVLLYWQSCFKLHQSCILKWSSSKHITRIIVSYRPVFFCEVLTYSTEIHALWMPVKCQLLRQWMLDVEQDPWRTAS